MPISAGTNWKGSNVEDKKADRVSGPQNKNRNNVRIESEMIMRILARLNVSDLYRV